MADIAVWEVALAIGIAARMLIPYLKKRAAQTPATPPGTTPPKKLAFEFKFLASGVVTWLIGGGLALISSDYWVALSNLPVGGPVPSAGAAFVIGLGGLDAVNKLLTG